VEGDVLAAIVADYQLEIYIVQPEELIYLMRLYSDSMVVRHSLAVLKQTLLRFGLFDLADNRLAIGTLLHKGDLFFGQISKQAPHRFMVKHFIQNIHVLILNQHHKVIFQGNVQLLSA
jgi:hypothetical protein